MVIISLHFSRKNGSKRKSFFAKKLCDYRDNRYFSKNQILEIIAISRFALGPSTAVCSLYGPLPPLRSSVHLLPNPSTAICPPLKPYVPSLALCPPPRYSVLSIALCPLYNPLPPLWPYVPSLALSSLYGPLRRSVPSTALFPLYDPLIPQQASVFSTALCPLYGPLSTLRPSAHSTAFCSLYGPLSSLWPSVHLTDLCTLTSFCLFCGPLSFLLPSVSSTAICTPLNPYVPATGHVPLYDTLCPLWSYVPSTTLCHLYGPLPPLRPSVTSTALCPLHCPLSPLQLFSPLWPPVSSEALCPLYGPLPPQQRSVPSFALCSFYGPLKNSEKSEMTCLVLINAFHQNSKGCHDLFCISDDQDHCDNHDYHSSEILSDNCEISIIALAKKGKKSCDYRNNHIQQEAIIVFCENLKRHFVSTIPIWLRIC